jgi:hypothetical protein
VIESLREFNVPTPSQRLKIEKKGEKTHSLEEENRLREKRG